MCYAKRGRTDRSFAVEQQKIKAVPRFKKSLEQCRGISADKLKADGELLSPNMKPKKDD